MLPITVVVQCLVAFEWSQSLGLMLPLLLDFYRTPLVSVLDDNHGASTDVANAYCTDTPNQVDSIAVDLLLLLRG
jgi:hypothetical protein